MRSFKPTKRFWQGYKGLYGSEPVQIDALKPKKKRQNIEEVEQIKFNVWFDKFLWEKDYRWFHSPNGGGRSPREGAKFKRMGVKRWRSRHYPTHGKGHIEIVLLRACN